MGLRKKRRMAEKADHARKSGFYNHAVDFYGHSAKPTPIGAGMKRAAARLAAEKAATTKRLSRA